MDTQTPPKGVLRQNAPQIAVEGAMIYQADDCASCHKINGIGERRDRTWIQQHFADPPKFSPNSIMPNYTFSPRDLKLITDYITSIPK
jgi:cbb3-type cytochrome oxidase cytochrome c subunit